MISTRRSIHYLIKRNYLDSGDCTGQQSSHHQYQLQQHQWLVFQPLKVCILTRRGFLPVDLSRQEFSPFSPEGGYRSCRRFLFNLLRQEFSPFLPQDGHRSRRRFVFTKTGVLRAPFYYVNINITMGIIPLENLFSTGQEFSPFYQVHITKTGVLRSPFYQDKSFLLSINLDSNQNSYPYLSPFSPHPPHIDKSNS
jgi:hypothetical protein